MGKRIKIPRTIEDKTARLVTLDALATATGWERAAIVASIVGPATGTGGANRKAKPESRLGVSEFAKLRIVGLRDRDTIRRYRDAWFIGAGMDMPEDGKQIELPDLRWPPVVAKAVAIPEPTKPQPVAKSTPKAEPASTASRPAKAASVAKAEEPQPVAQSHTPGAPGYDAYAERRQPDGTVTPDPQMVRMQKARRHMIEMFSLGGNMRQALLVLEKQADDLTDEEIEETWDSINKITALLKSLEGRRRHGMKVVK